MYHARAAFGNKLNKVRLRVSQNFSLFLLLNNHSRRPDPRFPKKIGLLWGACFVLPDAEDRMFIRL